MTSEPMISDGRPDLGSVIRDSIELLGANGKALLGPAMLLVALPALLGGLAHMLHAQFVAFLLFLAAFAGSRAFEVFAIFTVARDMDGEPASRAEAMAVAKRLWLPLAGLTIFMALAVMVGLVLLIVPGVMIYLMWCVAGPVLVLEGTDVATSLRRSAVLTHNRRWKLLLIFVVMMLVFACIEAILMIWPEALSHPFPLIKVAADAFVHGGLSIVWAVVMTVIYKDLMVEV